MALKKKSRNYTQDDGTKVSYTFDESRKLVGIKKDGVSLNPESVDFVNLTYTDQALSAYNISKYTSVKNSYEDSISIASKEERDNHYTTESKKEANAQFVESATGTSIASNVNSGTGYQIAGGSGKTDIMAYPLDINPHQDHFKITKYEYVRPDINQSKSQRDV